MEKETKNNCIKRIEEFFKYNNDTKNIFIDQINTIYRINHEYKLPFHTYKIGDSVLLKKGTFMHGTTLNVNKLDIIKENGVLSSDMLKEYNEIQKTPWCINVWNIQNNMKLSHYINQYSGATLLYCYQDNKRMTKLIPYNKMKEELEISKLMTYYTWRIEQTKEIRYMPSLAHDRGQIAFIFNTYSKEAKDIITNDVFNENIDKKLLASFIPKWFIRDFLHDKRNDFTTNREGAILVGMPSSLIEGILIGRIIEKDKNALKIIKENFPLAYICNLDGKVIVP